MSVSTNKIRKKSSWVVDIPKKIRKCPHCKSNNGFEMNYSITGNGTVKATFSGKTISAEREVFDENPRWVNCLNCGKAIDIEQVKTDYI